MLSFFISTLAFGHIGGFHEWPQNHESQEDIALWTYEDGWFISPEKDISYDGTRLGIFVERVEGAEISLEARWVDGEHYGPWQPLSETFTLPTLSLLIHDFPQRSSSIQFRSTDPSSMQYLDWDLLHPVAESEQQEPRSPLPPPPNTQLS